jgi:hypothetical protein
MSSSAYYSVIGIVAVLVARSHTHSLEYRIPFSLQTPDSCTDSRELSG